MYILQELLIKISAAIYTAYKIIANCLVKYFIKVIMGNILIFLFSKFQSMQDIQLVKLLAFDYSYQI